MSSSRLHVTYIGGPTALLELGGLRLLTDPTFDPAGSSITSTTRAVACSPRPRQRGTGLPTAIVGR